MFTKESSGNVKAASDSSYAVRQHRMILYLNASIDLYKVWIAKWLPPLSQYIAPIQGVKRVVELDGKFSNRAKVPQILGRNQSHVKDGKGV